MQRAGRLACITILALLAGSVDAAPHFPALTGRVVDNAQLLSTATQQQLTTELQEFEAKTSDQIVVVTVPSLEGATIEEYGVALGRHWGIGQKGKNNGVLLIMAPKERKLRIEVGYGLEGTLTDAASSDIVTTILIPAMKHNAPDAAALGGVKAIEQVLDPSGNYAVLSNDDAPSANEAPSAAMTDNAIPPEFGWIFYLIFGGVFLLFAVMFAPLWLGLPLYLILWLVARASPGLKRYLAAKKQWGGIPRFLFQIFVRTDAVGGFSSGTSYSSSSSSSSSDDDFGGGGGSFGGGGSSGSY